MNLKDRYCVSVDQKILLGGLSFLLIMTLLALTTSNPDLGSGNQTEKICQPNETVLEPPVTTGNTSKACIPLENSTSTCYNSTEYYDNESKVCRHP